LQAKEECLAKHNLRANTRKVSFVRGASSTGILKFGDFIVGGV
jgi:hypothetical protein